MRTYNQKRSHKQYVQWLCSNLIRWLKRTSRELSDDLLSAALVLLRLDLEPARDILESLYSPSPKGRPPYDPICMLRALLLMVLLKYKTIPRFVSDLKASHRFAIVAGFDPLDLPVAGTFYLFIDRLEDGKYQGPSEHIVKPSSLRKGRHLRNLATEKEQRKKDAEIDEAVHDSVTQKLKDELIASQEQPREDDITKRLEDILIKCAVIPSASRGLLGDTNSFTVAGDGSALKTGANPNGKPACKCHKNGIYKCEHSRYYSDPTADWGYDSYRDCYYFGHTLYQHVVSTNGHDLPLQVIISNASETDFTLSMKSMDRFLKALREHDLDWKIQNAIYDKGHDALGNCEYLMEYEITPVIALNERSSSPPEPSGTADKVNKDGIPLCSCGDPMKRHHHDKERYRIYYHCPVKRPTRRDGKHCWVTYVEECPQSELCQKDTKMGPVVYTRTEDDPRLFPPIHRGTDKFKELMKLRSGCERSNSLKKETYRLGKRPCRSAIHFLVRLYLVSIIEHAKTWLAEEEEKLDDDDTIVLIQALKA